jgi:hypothetical protein
MPLHCGGERIFIYSLLAFALCASDRLSAEPQAAQVLGARPEEVHHWREGQSCGVACGYLLARLLGREISYEDAVKAIPIHSGGTSLERLKKGLAQLGVEASVVRAKPGDIDSLRMPVIVHTLSRQEGSGQMGHFLLVLDISDHFVRYIEPNYAASIEKVTRNEFVRCWTGYLIMPKYRTSRAEWGIDAILSVILGATVVVGFRRDASVIVARMRPRLKRSIATVGLVLLIAGLSSGCEQTPLSLVPSAAIAGAKRRVYRPCQLVIGSTEVDLGILPKEGEATARFWIENQGDESVRLNLGAPTCRCTKATMEKSLLRPGEATWIRMSMRSRPDVAGPSDAQVYLTAEGQKWAETLHIHGIQWGARFPEYRYLVGGPTPSQTATITGSLYIRDAATMCRIAPSLAKTGLENALEIRDVQIGEPIAFPGYVERKCSFSVALRAAAGPLLVRRQVSLPISVRLGDTVTTREVCLSVLPTNSVSAD